MLDQDLFSLNYGDSAAEHKESKLSQNWELGEAFDNTDYILA